MRPPPLPPEPPRAFPPDDREDPPQGLAGGFPDIQASADGLPGVEWREPVPGPDAQAPGDETHMAADEAPDRRVAGWVKLSAAALLLLGALLFLRYEVFTIRHVRVFGTQQVTWQEVARSAGLDRRPFFFTLGEDEVRRGIGANRYLVFEGMEKVFPNTLVLRVRERKPFAFFTHLGIGYVLAQDGMVLEKSRDLSKGAGLAQVSGLSVWGELDPGTFPQTTDPLKVDGLRELLGELAAWGMDSQVQAVDVAQSFNLSLLTRDGYTVNLGDRERLGAKIGTVQSVITELRRRQMTGGIIEAAVPGEATYRAETR